MKVMPSVLGQVGNDIAGNLFEIGKSAVVGTAKAATDIVSETIEQVMSSPSQAATQVADRPAGGDRTSSSEKRKAVEKQRFEEVRGELARYTERKRRLDQEIAEEKATGNQQVKQKNAVDKREHDSWVSKVINRSQTTTERGRLSE